MAADVDMAVIKKTQETLGGFVKRPPLQEKFLRKPPFRFLHDIVTAVIRTTGFLGGIYMDAELNSENVKDKEKKIEFLQKAIDAVVSTTGETLTIRPGKVVAGQEPEKTNEFLQALAKAIIIHNKNKKQALKAKMPEKIEKSYIETKSKRPEKVPGKALKEQPVKPKPKIEESPKLRQNVNIEDKKNAKIQDNINKKQDSTPTKVKQTTGEKNVKNTVKINGNLKNNSKINAENGLPVAKPEQKENQVENFNTTSSKPILNTNAVPRKPENEKNLKTQKTQSAENKHPPNNKPAHPDSKTGPKQSVEKEQNVTSNLRPRSARPATARPAAPRIRQQEAKTTEPVQSTSAKIAPNVILDNSGKPDDDDETFVVEESEIKHVNAASNLPNDIDADKQGSLVKQLLETKKGLEGGSQHTPTDITKSQQSFSKIKQSEISTIETDKVKNYIQMLSSSAVPLGKVLDYLQEDIDGMNQEFKIWEEEHKRNVLALRSEESITEAELVPLHLQLDILENSIHEEIDCICAVKANILRNNERLEKMLSVANLPKISNIF